MTADAAINTLRSIVLALVLLCTFRLIALEKLSARMVFFTLAIACILFTDLYWLAFGILRPDTRMPFAANVIGEWALFLLLGASLASGKPILHREARWEMLFAILFSAASASLWIAWSDVWAQNILTALSLAYFLCSLVGRIKNERAFSTFHWRTLGILCSILIAAHTAASLVPEADRMVFEIFCCSLLFAVAVYLLIRAVLSIQRAEVPTHGMCHAFTAFAWVVSTMYMSSERHYAAAIALSAICFPLMFLSLKNELEAQ